MPFSQMAVASEKAAAVLLAYGLKADDLVSSIKKYPELKDLEVVSEGMSLHGDSLKLYSEDSNDVYTITKSESGVHIEKDTLSYEIETRTIRGDIRGTLFETIAKETQSTVLAEQMAEAFKDDFSTTKGLRVAASYELEVSEFFDGDRFVKYGNILKASLVIGQATSKKILKLDPETYAWSLQSEDLNLLDKPFYAPVRSSRVSSLFQLNRRHPVTRRHQPHNGIDFVAVSGTPIYPALDGEVITISRTRSKGKYITILHDNGLETTYIHLKKFQKGLRVGMRVELEDKIGEVGRTGYSTGAHLHFGVIKDGLYVNPIYFLKDYCYNEKDQHENTDLLEEQSIIDGEEPEMPIDL